MKYIDQQIRHLEADGHVSNADNFSRTPKPPASTSQTANPIPIANSVSGNKDSTNLAKWMELKDWASLFMAVLAFRSGHYQETLQLLEMTSNYNIVLHSGKFAFFTLLKAKSLHRLGHVDDAIKALNRRQVFNLYLYTHFSIFHELTFFNYIFK